MNLISKIILILLILLAFGSLLAYKVAPTRSQVFLDKIIGREPEPEPIVYQEELTIRIPEGSSNKEVAKVLAASGLFSEEDFLKAQKNYPSEGFDFLVDRPAGTDLEGYLYPDTYRFFASSTPEEVITVMLKNFDKKLTPDLRAEIIAQGKTISEIVIMASLIEKEAPIFYAQKDNTDAKIVSGIFWRRLENNQALQSCASLAYILGVNKPQYSLADTQTPSPFNTYLNRGLTPSPIANPGYLALEAAIYPTTTNYNYFLTPVDSKKMIYSATYEEHLINKNKYLPN
ncbi:MAG: endolytic transglycosylase MltG [Patescibacteria group bacterium]|nr:endolytic transglycosylase MltG [Patescibacteria group bacterium]MDD3435061.1 endolytic transglycosylase MltG [Patescibacteria group bacterium]